MKYIDAEKLKAGISGYWKQYHNREEYDKGFNDALKVALNLIDSLQQEESKEVDLEKFTERMNDWKARYSYPEISSIKATMAFTARMFYMYPDIARQWYDNLPKATQD